MNNPSTASSARSHLAWLDSIRCIAAIWVVAHHAFLTVQFAPVGQIQHALEYFLQKGHFAVTLFIAVSGYSLSLQASRNQWKLKGGYLEFVKARAFRILPPYYASIALSLILVATILGQKTGTHWDVAIPVTLDGVLCHLLLIQNFVGAPQINHVFWSVAVESQIYLFFGIILFALRKGGAIGLVVIAGLLSVGAKLFYSGLERTVPSDLLGTDRSLNYFFFVFCMGVLACKFASDYPNVGKRFGWPIFLFSLVLAVCALNLIQGSVQSFGLAVSMGLYALSTNESLQRWFSWKPLSGTGLFAYSIYLVHALVLQIVYNIAGVWRPQDTIEHSVEFIVISMPVCLAISYLFYVGVERPSIGLRKRFRKATAA